MSRRSDVVLDDILQAIAVAEAELASHDPRSFAADLFLQRGAERSLEIISEAVRHLPAELLSLRPDISWADVRGIGNRIRHEYWRIDPGLIWSIVIDDLPVLPPGPARGCSGSAAAPAALTVGVEGLTPAAP